ncbi:hypothetical protein [Streptomyces sp. B1I3]|uniref:hypothetical protein n=1 Tax=Streptomyces sp. B1I3 TaxID=3042264 RepID=UPI00278A5F2B|nr:hypothetical protein [Streptomyces sp. B1I3]MDQ0791958.1 phage-related protein [Streptomyces sp. B1I3]
MAISVGSVEVDVIPNTRGIYQHLRSSLVPAATRAGSDAGNAAGRAFGPAMQSQVGNVGLQIGRQIGQQIAAQITAQIRTSLTQGIRQGGAAARPAATRQGEETGGAFARAARARIEAAFRSLPDITVGADTSEADSDLQALRARMESLAGKRIGVDIDATEARAEITDIEEQLRRLGASHPDVTVRADTARARAELAAVREEIDRISANPGTIRLETDGSFGQRLRAQVQAAEASLPNINIGADTSPAQAEIASLRGQLTALSDQRIGIDIDAATALARITELQARLQRLSASDADVAVRVDAANAMAQLAVVQAMVTRLDGQSARVNVNTAGALNAILHLTVAIGGLAVIPAIPVLAAGIGAIGSAAVAAGVGVGALAAVAIPAVINIAGALQAQKAAQDAASASTMKGAQSSGQGASKALQLAGAQQSLASAHRNAARQIGQAEQAVGDAVRSSAEANRQAAQQVKQARQSLADAVQQAADRQRDSAEQVARAEESLADAQRTARQAQQDLTQARRDAAQELADLADQLANARLSERDATLDVQEAQARLRAVQAVGSKATIVEQQRAQLAYDQAVQRLKEQKAETRSLSSEQAKADKAGVEGSETVKAAQERIAEAEKDVADQGKALSKARDDAARQQVKSQQDIAQAQEKVAESQRNVAKTQADGARSVQRAQESLAAAQQSAADSIAGAQRQIASASQSAAGGVDQAALAQAKYRAELAKMTPAARGTFDAFVSLRSAFKAWSTSLQPQVMPLFTRALIGLKNSLPGLTPFVLAAARAIGELQDRVSAGFKSPWWKGFKADLAGSVEPAIVGLGVSFGRTFKGMAGIIQAFLPHMDSISQRMQDITGRFANWGTSLKGSEKFEGFLAYSNRMGPILAEAIGDISSAFYQLSKAVSPLSGPVLKALGAVALAIADIARDLPWLIQLLYAVWIATKLWTLAMLAFNLVMDANPITLIIVGIVALVAAVIYAYKNFAWFRDLVNGVWSAIQTAALWAWNNVLKPVFNGIWAALKAVGAVASWLWANVLSPVFNFIATAAKILFTALVVVVLLPIIAAIKVLGAIGKWLWDRALGPAFRAIGAAASWLWKNVFNPVFTGIGDKAKWLWNNAVKPVFGQFKTGIQQLADKAKWLWSNVLSPVFGWIGDKGRWLWDKALKPAFDNIKKGVKLVSDSFGTAKDAIKKAWDKLEGIAKKPVAFIVNTVYEKGIRPTWNTVAKVFGAPTLPAAKGFARGGVLPGASTYRQGDDQLVPMRRGEGVYVSEAMRDPYERARLHAVNQAAMRGKPLSEFQGFAKGGIFDWVGKAASKTVDFAKTGASWLKDGMKASATAGLNAVVKPLVSKIAGSKSLYRDMVTGIPKKMIKAIVGFSGQADTKLGQAGIGGGGFKAGLKWARTQNGLPYQWGGNGNPSWDCSGLTSAIESVIRGQKPHRRWATGSFSGKTAPGGWQLGGKSPYMIGITNAGVGHTAGTINGVNVESRGGGGVVIGSRARSYMDPLFTHRYAYKGKYDSGGYLQPGLNLAYNGTGRPEPVFTTAQANALTSVTAGGGVADGPVEMTGQLVLDSGELMGKFRGVVRQENSAVLTALRSRPVGR